MWEVLTEMYAWTFDLLIFLLSTGYETCVSSVTVALPVHDPQFGDSLRAIRVMVIINKRNTIVASDKKGMPITNQLYRTRWLEALTWSTRRFWVWTRSGLAWLLWASILVRSPLQCTPPATGSLYLTLFEFKNLKHRFECGKTNAVFGKPRLTSDLDFKIGAIKPMKIVR